MGGGEFDKDGKSAEQASGFFILCAKEDCRELARLTVFLLSNPDRTAAPDTICQAI